MDTADHYVTLSRKLLQNAHHFTGGLEVSTEKILVQEREIKSGTID